MSEKSYLPDQGLIAPDGLASPGQNHLRCSEAAYASHTDPTKKRRGKTDGYHRAMEAMEEEAEPSENGGDREGGGDSSPVDENNSSGGEQGGNDMAGGDGSEG
ncbi:hypothetical protein C8J57DRAFT_1225169 [Mycena rebaudengoi]|nr:hypothetical protein C8J57DRAFT_1225169 [Mycena rebaudengoi]